MHRPVVDEVEEVGFAFLLLGLGRATELWDELDAALVESKSMSEGAYMVESPICSAGKRLVSYNSN